MAKPPKITINQAELDRYQEQVNETLRATLREVRDEMKGRPVDEVQTELSARLEARIPNVTLHDDKLREYAAAISDGTLTG